MMANKLPRAKSTGYQNNVSWRNDSLD